MPKRAPLNWEPETKKSYRDFCRSHELADDEQNILVSTFDRLDAYHKAGKQVAKDGMTFISANGVLHKHPLLAVQKEAWTGFIQGLKLLEFSGDDTPKRTPGRPAQGIGVS